MPTEEEFRRDRDPRTRRNARIAGAFLGACLLAIIIALAVVRQPPFARTDPSARATSSPAPVREVLPSLSPTPVPADAVVGFSFSAAYDERRHRLVTFGGVDSYDATWLWDGSHWSLARPPQSPPGRFAAAAAYDPLTGVVMLYGGRLGPGQVVDDTWAWDGTTWRQLDGGSGNPPAGEGSVMAWDGPRNQMVLVNAQPGSAGGTWTWDGARWAHQARGSLPAGTEVVGLATDPVAHVLLAVTCCAVNNGTASTLAWDGAVWHTMTTHTTPGFAVGVVRDPLSDRLLLFGDPAIAPGRDLWSWSGRDWTLVATPALPIFPTRAVADTDAGHVVIVGSVAEPVQGHPQPLHVWTLTTSGWHRLG